MTERFALLAFVVLSSNAWSASNCATGANQDKRPFVQLHKACTSQTACCEPGLECRNQSGFHCELPIGASTTTTTKPPGPLVTTSTKPSSASSTSGAPETFPPVVTTTSTRPTPSTIPSGSCSAKRGSVRPTTADITISVDNPHLWWRGCQATQTERDAMIQKGFDMMGFEIRYGRTNPSCAQQARACEGNLSEIRTRFNSTHPYDDILGPPVNEWDIRSQAANNLYDVPLSCHKKIRECSLSGSGKNNCYNNPLMTPELMALLDIRKQEPGFFTSGQCVTGSSMPWPGNPSNKPYQNGGPGDDGTGIARGDINLGVPTGESLRLLNLVHPAHMAVTEYLCGRGPKPTGASAQQAHIDFENSPFCTQDENHRRGCRMKEFNGVADTQVIDPHSGVVIHPGWTPRELCHIAELQDVFHGRWSREQLRGIWGPIRQPDTGHSDLHGCENVYGDFVIRPPCADPADMEKCPKLTCQEYLHQMYPNG